MIRQGKQPEEAAGTGASRMVASGLVVGVLLYSVLLMWRAVMARWQ